MTNPWDGPRHRSWASDTMIFAVVFIILLGLNVAVQLITHQQPPEYLTGLLGASSAALYGAAGSDKSKREREIADDARVAKERATSISDVANRADAKADKLAGLAKAEHPDRQEWHEPPLDDVIEGGGP